MTANTEVTGICVAVQMDRAALMNADLRDDIPPSPTGLISVPYLATHVTFGAHTSMQSTELGERISLPLSLVVSLPIQGEERLYSKNANSSGASPPSPMSPLARRTQRQGSNISEFSGAMSPTLQTPIGGLRSPDDVIVETDLLLQDKYYLCGFVGQSAFGLVVEVKCKTTLKRFAAKKIPCVQMKLEIAIAKLLDNPHIVKLHSVIESDDHFHLVMDLCKGGPLSAWIESRKRVSEHGEMSYLPPSSRDAAILIWQMLKGVAYLHHHRIAHRNIKPSKFLLTEDAFDVSLKLGDFALACRYHKGCPMTQPVGSLWYMAPEVMMGQYTSACDIWSIGCTAFLLSVHSGMFVGEEDIKVAEDDQRHDAEVRRLVLRSPINYESMLWSQHARDLRMLVAAMLQRDPKIRPSARKLLTKNKWLRQQGRGTSSSGGCCSVS